MALCLMLVLSLAVTAFAAEGGYTITITNSDAASSAGHKYEAYQIFAGVLDSTGAILTEISWGQNMTTNSAAFLEALKADTSLGEDTANLFYNAKNAADVAGILAKPENHTSTVLDAFAKAATKYVSQPPVAYTVEQNAPYTITIPADKSGYYLVKDVEDVLTNATNKDVSDFILQVVGNVTVEHKGSIPTMDKTVSETGNTYGDAIATGIGETHYYRIVAELPDDYRLYDTYYLEFSDKMSAGLTYDGIVAVKAIIRSSGTTVELAPSSYKVITSELGEDDKTAPGGTHLRVVINDLKTAQPTEKDVAKATLALTADDAIEVIYKAHVNDKAVVDGKGIPNTASIIYSNNPNSDGKGESTPDETNVYPINLKLVKVDGKEKTVKLEGAEFVLSRPYSSDGIEQITQYAVVDEENKISEWVEHYAGDGCNDSVHGDGIGLASVLTTDENGEFNVIGLDTGRYGIIEITPPDGYNKLVEAVIVSVSIEVNEASDTIFSMTGNTSQGSIEFSPEKATVTLTIDNYKGDVLPSTGGIGTTLFYILGGLMVVGAAVLLITKKRMSAEG